MDNFKLDFAVLYCHCCLFHISTEVEVFIYEQFNYRVTDHSIVEINYTYLCNSYALQRLN